MGQSVSGMYSIISSICLPGQSIFDPFAVPERLALQQKNMVVFFME